MAESYKYAPHTGIPITVIREDTGDRIAIGDTSDSRWAAVLAWVALGNTIAVADPPITYNALQLWALDQRKRLPYFASIAKSLFDDMTNTAGVTDQQLLNNALAIGATNAGAAAWFQAFCFRMGIIATPTTAITPAVVAAMTAANRRILMQCLYDFVNGGLGIGLAGLAVGEN